MGVTNVTRIWHAPILGLANGVTKVTYAKKQRKLIAKKTIKSFSAIPWGTNKRKLAIEGNYEQLKETINVKHKFVGLQGRGTTRKNLKSFTWKFGVTRGIPRWYFFLHVKPKK